MITQSLQKLEFDSVSWKTIGEFPEFQIEPIPGTWTLAPTKALIEKGIKAFISCPRCSTMGMLPDNAGHKIEGDAVRDAVLLDELHCDQCGFTCEAVLKDWDSRKLYCAKFTRYPGKKIRTIHFHALDHKDAEKQWIAQAAPSDCLIGVAKIIGLFSKDKDGKHLSVD